MAATPGWVETQFSGGDDRVSGWTRFEVGRLCRSSRGKRRLERGPGALAAVQRVDANLRTGSLLLVYAPGVALDEILYRIAAVLGVAPSPAARGDPKAAKPARLGLTLAQRWRGYPV